MTLRDLIKQAYAAVTGSTQETASNPGKNIINPLPNEPIEEDIFSAPVFYQKAKKKEIEPTNQGKLSLDQLLEGYGRYGATPSAQAVQEMVNAQDQYPVFEKNPALLPGLSIIETSAGQNMTRPKGDNPQNLMNWGIYTDFIPRDQAHSVNRAASGIGERMSPYQKFRETNELKDFTDRYAPESDGNEGYLENLNKAMQYFLNNQ